MRPNRNEIVVQNVSLKTTRHQETESHIFPTEFRCYERLNTVFPLKILFDLNSMQVYVVYNDFTQNLKIRLIVVAEFIILTFIV